MLSLDIRDFTQAEWTDLTAGFGGQCLVQSWAYAEAKARTGPWTVERGLIKEGGATVGAFHALVRRLPYGLPGGLAWINRGPLWAGGEAGSMPEPARLLAMMAALKGHYVGKRRLYLRLAPPVTEEALGKDVPAGFVATDSAGWASAELDLSPDTAALRRKLRGRWRNHLSQAERASLEVRSSPDESTFSAFLSAYRRFLEVRAFSTTVTPELLAALHDILPAAERPRVLLGIREGVLLGATLIATTGPRAEYLAGFVEDAGRGSGVGQLLLWNAVNAMKSEGIGVFDVGGMDPDNTPRGIYDFKNGLGATPYRLAAEREAGGESLIGRLVRWRIAGARKAA
jgi:hypothetical protein